MGRSQIYLESIALSVGDITALKCALNHCVPLFGVQRESSSFVWRSKGCNTVGCVCARNLVRDRLQDVPPEFPLARPTLACTVANVVKTRRHHAPHVIKRPKILPSFAQRVILGDNEQPRSRQLGLALVSSTRDFVVRYLIYSILDAR